MCWALANACEREGANERAVSRALEEKRWAQTSSLERRSLPLSNGPAPEYRFGNEGAHANEEWAPMLQKVGEKCKVGSPTLLVEELQPRL